MCDTGNHTVRCIRSVHSLEAPHLVYQVQIYNAPIDWHPYGISVLDRYTLIVSCLLERLVSIINLDETLVSGHVLKNFVGFTFPRGLATLKLNVNRLILVAAKDSLKSLDPVNGTIVTLHSGFSSLFDVAVDSENRIAVSDIQADTVHLLSASYNCAGPGGASGFQVNQIEVWGTGRRGNRVGPACSYLW